LIAQAEAIGEELRLAGPDTEAAGHWHALQAQLLAGASAALAAARRDLQQRATTDLLREGRRASSRAHPEYRHQ
jgi:hypothetical protein